MASDAGFVEHIARRLSAAGAITYKKMFGEYGLYCDGKIFALVCDDQLFIKITESGRAFAPHLETAPPYDGAKDYFLIEDVDDADFLTKLTAITCEALPAPKPKKPKKK